MRNLPGLVSAGMILVLIAGTGLVLFLRSQVIMREELRKKLLTIAAVAAAQFDGDALANIQGQGDMGAPLFQNTVARLHALREAAPDIRFTYIMRRTADPLTLTFVADADSLASFAELDENGNGRIDEAEQPSFPGDAYDISQVPALQAEAFEQPTVDQEITKDQWGAFISGYAPIRRADGTVEAVLGIDMTADDFLRLSQRIFTPVAFLLFLLSGGAAAVFAFSVIWQRRLEAIRQVEAERSELIALASHELGTPLSIFKWWTEILRDRQKENPNGDDLDISTQIEEGIARLERVVSTLRNVRELSEGTRRYQPKQESLKRIIEDTAGEFAARLQTRKQKLALALGKDEMPMQLDRELIAGVIREFIDNAMRYSPEGTTITIRAGIVGDTARVEVQDHGHGIPEEDLPRIFQKFCRGSNATKYKVKGSGMGLFIAKKIIEQAGGEISLRSKEGQGTTISFTLPLLAD